MWDGVNPNVTLAQQCFHLPDPRSSRNAQRAHAFRQTTDRIVYSVELQGSKGILVAAKKRHCYAYATVAPVVAVQIEALGRIGQNRQNRRIPTPVSGWRTGVTDMHTGLAHAGSLFTRRGQRKYLTTDERRRFLIAANAAARPEVRTLCLTLALTGCRISEALLLAPMSVALSEAFLCLRSLKKRDGAIVFREVPVPFELVHDLRTVHNIDHGDAGGRLWSLSRGRAWQLVKQIMKVAGVSCGPHATPKGLRHVFGLHAIRSGVPLNLVQRWLGHASMTTTAIYLQAMGVEEREFAARMWDTAA